MKKSKVIIGVIILLIFMIAMLYCKTRNVHNTGDIENKDQNIESKENIGNTENNYQDSSEFQSDESNFDYEKQIDLILNNKALWYKDDEFSKYSYAITDLDKNRRFEIISSSCQGTGIYTYTEIYEVNENIDKLNICKSNLIENDSQADIIKNTWNVFYDSDNKEYHYVFDDLTKNGAAEYYENKRDFCLDNGKIIERYLARKDTIYQNDRPNVTCMDFNENLITEEQYNNFEDEFFYNYEKMSVNIEWLSNYTEIGIDELKHSYNKFEIHALENQ